MTRRVVAVPPVRRGLWWFTERKRRVAVAESVADAGRLAVDEEGGRQ